MPSKIERVVGALRRFYGLLPAPPHDPFVYFVWEVLSTHSTPQQRDAALAALKRVPALTPESIFHAPRKKLDACVALAGPYRDQRVAALRTGADIFRRSPDLPAIIKGPLVAARRAIKPLPQLGEAGAHRMLLFMGEHPVLPVDARLARVALRLGYGDAAGGFRRRSRSVQQAMAPELPHDVDVYRRAFLYLSHHGGATCIEAEPHCGVCPVVPDCPEGQKRLLICDC